MRTARLILLTLIWMASTASAQADYVTYTESAFASGALGGSNFSNALVTLTSVGQLPGSLGVCTGVPNCTVGGGPISVNVSGVGSATFMAAGNNAAQGVVDNFGNQTAGMSVYRLPNGQVGNLILFTNSPAFATYNISHSIGPITGSAVIAAPRGFQFPTSGGTFFLSSVSANSTFTAVSTLTQQGGTLASPATFSQQGLGQISASIGGLGSEASYGFSWSGGNFSATATVSGANAAASYEYQLSEWGLPGVVIADEILNGADSFAAAINQASLLPGQYVISLLANNPNDPMFTIDFATPVNGTATPEPNSITLFIAGLALMFFFAIRQRALSE